MHTPHAPVLRPSKPPVIAWFVAASWSALCASATLTACNAGQILSNMGQTNASSQGGLTDSTTTSPAPPVFTGVPAQPPSDANTPCKRGLAYNAMGPADWQALSPNVVWFYSWSGQAQPASVAADANAMQHYVPMVWGKSQLGGIAVGSLPGSGFLLGFNEPNFGSQANLSATAAAALWPRVEAIALAQNMNIVSPAVNYCGGACQATSPFDWLDAFFAACPNCRVDAIGVHSYMCNPNDVQNYLAQFETRYNKPLWVTEFACLDTPNQNAATQQSFMTSVVAMMEADPMVHRYAWFTGRDPGAPAVDILSTSGALTPLGQTYVSLPQACAQP